MQKPHSVPFILGILMNRHATGKLETMTDTAKPAPAIEARAEAPQQQQAYRQPVLVKLGSIRDLTLKSGKISADGGGGRKSNATSRGGAFEDCSHA